MASQTVTPVRTCNVVVLGKTGAGKSTVANAIMTDEGQHINFKVSKSSLDSETKKAQLAEVVFKPGTIEYRIKMVDTQGFFETGGEITNKAVLQSIKKFFKEKLPEGVSLVLFVFKRARYTDEEKKTFRYIIDNFRSEISGISALVVTSCDELDEDGRKALIKDLETNKETKDMAAFMGKGIYPVGFPPLDKIKKSLRDVYKTDIRVDQETLRKLVFSCHELCLSKEIWNDGFWDRCIIL